MQIPFSLPLIDADVIAEVHDCLTNTGWLTSGPKVAALETELARAYGLPAVCVNSWTSGAMLVLRWMGVGPGDEVIVPAYTYCATALCALNLGARVVMTDVAADFTMDVQQLERAITPRTKAILPVDIGGWPCDYRAIMDLVRSDAVRQRFAPSNDLQAKVGRPLVLADAAHSIGSRYGERFAVHLPDVSVFSFHSVKNITTGEGGAVLLNLGEALAPDQAFRELKILSLNGQTKSAFEKNQAGGWRYDIVAQGLKVNMPDLCAAVGLAQLRKYESELLPERHRIVQQYNGALAERDWAVLPPVRDGERQSSNHLYMLRIRNFGEAERNALIQRLADVGIGTNVHYIPLPMLTLFQNLGYRIEDYPNSWRLSQHEISLPVYNGLTEEQVQHVISRVIEFVESSM